MLVKYYLKVERKYFMVNEDKTFENEVDKSDNHGGKRPGAGRPFGAKTKKNWKSMEEMAVKYQHSPLDYLLSVLNNPCLLYTSPSPRDGRLSRMPSSA